MIVSPAPRGSAHAGYFATVDPLRIPAAEPAVRSVRPLPEAP